MQLSNTVIAWWYLVATQQRESEKGSYDEKNKDMMMIYSVQANSRRVMHDRVEEKNKK